MASDLKKPTGRLNIYLNKHLNTQNTSKYLKYLKYSKYSKYPKYSKSESTFPIASFFISFCSIVLKFWQPLVLTLFPLKDLQFGIGSKKTVETFKPVFKNDNWTHKMFHDYKVDDCCTEARKALWEG